MNHSKVAIDIIITMIKVNMMTYSLRLTDIELSEVSTHLCDTDIVKWPRHRFKKIFHKILVFYEGWLPLGDTPPPPGP